MRFFIELCSESSNVRVTALPIMRKLWWKVIFLLGEREEISKTKIDISKYSLCLQKNEKFPKKCVEPELILRQT